MTLPMWKFEKSVPLLCRTKRQPLPNLFPAAAAPEDPFGSNNVSDWTDSEWTNDVKPYREQIYGNKCVSWQISIQMPF